MICLGNVIFFITLLKYTLCVIGKGYVIAKVNSYNVKIGQL